MARLADVPEHQIESLLGKLPMRDVSAEILALRRKQSVKDD
jgi:hypothetical protein